MFQQIKNKVTSPEFTSALKTTAIEVVTAIAIRVVIYVVVQGTKSLIEEIGKNKETPAE